MERSILTVEPVPRGWLVSLKGRALAQRPTKIEAIGLASECAAERHKASGSPTGVSVRLGTGDTVLVALHGWDGQTVRGSLRRKASPGVTHG
jgi:hypothetical protein